MKWDGLRALAFVSGGQVRLTSRTARDITFVYPELAGLATAVGADQAVLDGEIVAFGGGSWPDFEALQQRMNISTAAQAKVLATQVPVSYLAFDLLWLNGRPLLDEPYTRRRELLDRPEPRTAAGGRCRRRSSASPLPISRRSPGSSTSKVSWPRGSARDTSPGAGRRHGARSRTFAGRRS